MMKPNPMRCSAFTVLALCASASAQVPIAVANHGFEAQAVAPGCFAVFAIQDWDAYDPMNILDSSQDVLGGLHPESGPYFPMAPEGQVVALVFIAGDVGGGEVGISQTLGESLMAGFEYRLTVEVGDIASGTGPPPCDGAGFFNLDGFPGYRVELWAGDELVLRDDNTLAAVLDDGLFATSETAAVIDEAHPGIDETLEIRLINLNQPGTPMEPGIEVDFDDVRLVRTPVSVCAADFDSDGDVDLTDFGTFGAAFGSMTGDANYDAAADFDGDGDVDLTDFGTFGAEFGSTAC